MHPRGGNGACQAFVDARVVAECLSIHESVEEAFVQYETQRLPIANKIVMANRGDGPEVVRPSWRNARAASASTTSKKSCRSKRTTRFSSSTIGWPA